MASKPETRVQELHLTLPKPAKPVATCASTSASRRSFVSRRAMLPTLEPGSGHKRFRRHQARLR